MTFISKSPKYPRLYESDIRQQGRVGPGSYNPNSLSPLSDVKNSQYVFNSKISRNIDGADKGSEYVGPGKYNTQGCISKFLVKKLSHACQSSFKSQIERFPQKKQQLKQQNKFELQNVYQHLLDGEETKKNIGKLYGISRDQTKVRHQSVPSIPTNEQSYGYRIDQKTKKLVQNQNPNVLLAKNTFNETLKLQEMKSANSLGGGPGSYFIKSQSAKLKGPLWHKQIRQQQSTKKGYKQQKSEIQRLVCNDRIFYQKDGRKWLQKGNSIINKQNRFDDMKSNKKNSLLMNSLKKKFCFFVNQDSNIEQIIQQGLKKKMEIINAKSSNSSHYEPGSKIQCFLAQSNRFSNNANQHQSQMNNASKLMDISIHKNQNNSKQIHNQSFAEKKNHEVPFGTNTNRFQHMSDTAKNKNIGPGSYFVSPGQTSPQKGNHWSMQQQTRFKSEQIPDGPGPGSYQVQSSMKLKKSICQSKQIHHVQQISKLQQKQDNKAQQKQEQKHFCYNSTSEKQQKQQSKIKAVKEKSKQFTKINNEQNVIKQIKRLFQQK